MRSFDIGSYGGSRNQAPRFGSPYDEDHSILGPILGPPADGNSICRAVKKLPLTPLCQDSSWARRRRIGSSKAGQKTYILKPEGPDTLLVVVHCSYYQNN